MIIIKDYCAIQATLHYLKIFMDSLSLTKIHVLFFIVGGNQGRLELYGKINFENFRICAFRFE